MRSLLTEGRSEEFGLLCQFDDFTTSMFIVAEELATVLPATREMMVPGVAQVSLR